MTMKVSNGGRVTAAAGRGRQAAAKPSLQKGVSAPITDRLEWSSGPVLDPEKKALLALLQSGQQKEKSSIESVSEFLTEQARVRRLCARIAARIRAGDRVPMQDRRYLKARDPLQYAMATLMQKPNDDPRRRASLLQNRDKTPPRTAAPTVCAGEEIAPAAGAAAKGGGQV